jgi:hypothetical protein
VTPPATPPAPAGADLDRLLPPQIRNERFYRAIRRAAAAPGVRTVLEIGASSGGGSTEALVAGALANPEGPPEIHSIEVSKPRFAALVQRYRDYPFVHPHNVSSVPSSAFPSEERVTRFHREVRSKLRNNRLPKVLGWLRQDLAYLAEHPDLDVPGIRLIREQHGIERYDAVCIDGSEFTGEAELEEVYGARLLLLDDTRSYKNWANQRRLARDPAYRRVAWSWWTRNGWSVFERVDPGPAPRAGPPGARGR